MICDYQGYDFGASYKDSVCVDGYLHDADDCDSEGNVYLNDEEIPCPKCNQKERKKWIKEVG